MPERVPGLLVSVRCAAEARTALAGGAALIDVKEPAHGPLGRADDAVIADVVRAVAGRVPVSAALGEWDAGAGPPAVPGLTFVKWGLAGCASAEWRETLQCRTRPQRVLVAYADWQCARAPSVEDVFAAAAERPGRTLLVDTHCKQPATRAEGRPPTLLDWLRIADVVRLCRDCRDAGIQVALAGCLGRGEIAALGAARPHWFAVRGAACDGGRGGEVRADKVRELVSVIGAAASRAG